MNRIKNNVIVPLKSQTIVYNPIRDVCRLLGDSCLVLSPNMDQMTNGGNIGLIMLILVDYNNNSNSMLTVEYFFYKY